MIRFRGYFGNKRAAVSTGLDIDFTTGTLDPRITFTRGSAATYYNSSGLIASAASGAPRFDYDPVALTPRGLLLEEQRTNLLLQSQNIADAVWLLYGTAAKVGIAGVADPAGGSNAHEISFGGTAGSILYQPVSLANGSYVGTLWVRAKSGTTTVRLNLSDGAVNRYSADLTVTAAAWTRLVASWPSIVPTGSCYFGVGHNSAGTSGDVYVYGAQLEAGANVTSYIPTTTVAITRAADTASMTGANFSSWYNATEGTFFLSLDFAALIADFHFLNVFQAANATANRMAIYGDPPKFADYITESGSGPTKNTTLAAPAVTGPSKFALAFKTNDAASSCNGAAAITDTSVTVPTVDSLNLGRSEVDAALATGWFKRLTFYNTRKTNAELQALTALPVVGTGALAAQAAVAASTTGVSGSLITDTTLNASAAVLSSTTGVSGSTITDTTLNAASAVLSSTTGVSGSLITDTTLNASPAAVSSTTGLVRAIGNASALTAQAATVIGLGTGAGAATIGAGALSSSPATLVSAGLTRTIGSGVLVDGSATLSALAVSGSAGVGSLNVTAADIDSLGYVEQGGVSIMIGGEWQRTTPYVRVGGTWKPATAWANVNGVWKRAA